MIELVPFAEEHYYEYKKWFDKDAIKNALGYIDEEWLHYILSDASGIEYAIFRNKIMLAVVGISLPKASEKSYVINNIAVNPDYFGQGIGSLVLKELVLHHAAKEDESWLAYVDVHNEPAQKFFLKNNWTELIDDSDDTMKKFVLNKIAYIK